MKTLIKLTVIASSLLIVACSSKEKRNVWTDPVMRVMIDPDTIDAHNYVRITNALIKNGKFTVIDRGAGYMAARKEQERLHLDKIDRFDDREKFAHWKKLYGVGGVIVAHSQCQRVYGYFGTSIDCRNNLAIINATTGEVITTAEDNTSSKSDPVADWSETVSILSETFPKHFEDDKTNQRLYEYKELSKEEALRARELLSQKDSK